MRKIIKKIALLILILGLAYCIGTAVSIWNYSYVDEKRSADVAIILGAETVEGEVSPVYRERINHAISLYNNSYVSKLIVTGGVGEGNTMSDAETAAQYAAEQGIPNDAIFIEKDSTITQENIENAKKIMLDNNMHTAIIVSDPLHMKRAMQMAADYGIEAYSSPTTTSRYVSLKTKIPFLLRETFFYIGYQIYRLI